jgi:hypothetical protein
MDQFSIFDDVEEESAEEFLLRKKMETEKAFVAKQLKFHELTLVWIDSLDSVPQKTLTTTKVCFA